MRTIHFRAMLVVLPMLAFAGGATAQDRSTLLKSIEVKRLVASGEPADHARLRDHFAALADEYAADAKTHQAKARAVTTGNPNHPPVGSPGWPHVGRADSAAATAATLRDLSAHHGRLAERRSSTAPAGTARFEAGEGAPEPSQAQVRELVASARTAADHRSLEEYFAAFAEKQTRAAETYTARAQAYQGLTRTAGLYAAVYWERRAETARESAAEARASAAEQRRLAGIA